jgi:hypothetical protein
LLGLILDLGAERCQQFVEERHRRVRVDAGAGAQGVLPASLQDLPEFVAHPVGGVGVEPAHSRYFVAEALLGEDLGDAILGHPGLVTVPEPVRGQAGLDRKPAAERSVLRDSSDSAACGWGVAGV